MSRPEPVRWGFLGAGNIARSSLAPAVHAADGAQLYAVAARDPGRAAELGASGPVYRGYEELLADPAVEAVYVGLHNAAHLPWTLAAAAAGKPVLCEKPLGLSAAEVDRMAAAGGLVVEASWYRWHPRVRLAQRLLAEGRIGTVQRVEAGFTFAADLAGNYRMDQAMGGGALYDVGCYAVSAVLWAMGGRPPDVVAARAALAATGVDADSQAYLRWQAGATAHVHAAISAERGQWLRIVGTDGSIDLPDNPYTAWREHATELLVVDASGVERLAVAAVDPYRLMVEDFSAMVRGVPAWLLPLTESRAGAAVLDACFASLRAAGRPVRPTP